MSDTPDLFEFLESQLEPLPCECFMASGNLCEEPSTKVAHFTPCLHSSNSLLVCDEHAERVRGVDHPFLCLGNRCVVSFIKAVPL